MDGFLFWFQVAEWLTYAFGIGLIVRILSYLWLDPDFSTTDQCSTGSEEEHGV